MKCPKCHRFVPDGESRNHVCVPKLIGAAAIHSGPRVKKKWSLVAMLSTFGKIRLRIRKDYLLGGVGVVVAIIVGLGLYQNNQAGMALHRAKDDISKGDFAKAEAELNIASGYFARGSVRKDIKATKVQNSTWLGAQKKLDDATALFRQDNLSDAESLLARIDKKFPAYAKVTSLQQEIASRRQAIADATKAVADAEAAAKTAPTSRPKEGSFRQPTVATTNSCYEIGGISTRSTTDRADDASGSQLHVVYAVPSDAADQSYDTNGRIAASVSAFQNWLCNQTGGRELRLDTHQGKLDVTFVRFTSTDNAIRTGAELPHSTNPNSNPYVRDDVETRLNNLGLNQANKIYLVYYDGSSNYACGGASWPPTVAGHGAVMYLKGDGCTGNQLSSTMGYWEFAMLHDTLHTLGAVATCAPHHTLNGHVSDGNNDLMYSGSQPWYPSVLDNGHDDYYNHNNSGCFDLADSALLTP